MDLQRPIIDQVSTGATNAQAAIATGVKTASDSVVDAVGKVRETLGEFSTAATNAVSASGSSGGFLDLNGMVAKVAFLILVMFGFLTLLRLGISLIGYFSQNSRSPYVIRGMLGGQSSVIISQDPAVPNSVPIPRSNDKTSGAEFTWSIWLFVDQSKLNDGQYQPIFVKGFGEFNPTTGIRIINGPGMYLTTQDTTTLKIVMDTVDGKNEEIDVPNIPQQKWVHVAARLRNTTLAVYVNGVVAKQLTMAAAPSQNYQDVFVFPNGGVTGNTSLSDLRYFDSALDAFGINNIVMFGPNKKQSSLTTSAAAVGGNYTYLSNQWY